MGPGTTNSRSLTTRNPWSGEVERARTLARGLGWLSIDWGSRKSCARELWHRSLVQTRATA